MNSKKLLSVILAGMLLISSILPCYAATTQDKIQDAKAEKEKTESSLSDTKSRINNLQSEKSESETYLTELNAQLEDLKNTLEQLQKDFDAKQVELEKVQKELAEAKKQEARQYEDMKLRIQFMYEKSSIDYLDMLLSSDGFTEFLNRADNISQISEYDRQMLKEYEKTKEIIKEKNAQVKEEKAAIEALQAESAVKQGEVEEVVASTYNQISEYAAELENAESEEAALLSRVSQQEASINGLLKQAKDEEAAAAKAKAEAKAQAEAKAAAKEESQRQSADEAQEDTSDSEQSSDDSDYEAPSSDNADEGTVQEEVQEETQKEVESESSDSGSGSQGTYLGSFKLTAYCSCSSCCGSWSGGPTASGAMPSAGRTVAMGGVPFGTKLLINGNVYTVEDRGTAYGHVDIYMGSHSQALSFGLKYADVYQVN